MSWTHERLTRLFERYRALYWPRSRRLKKYRVQISPRGDAVLEGGVGLCDDETRTLHILVSGQPDREIRATVLHEMIHVVAGPSGHSAPFWTQLEYLLSRKAPITVGFPEMGERGQHPHVIPPRFKRCRKLFASAYRKDRRWLHRATAETATQELTIEDFARECEDMAIEGMPWRDVWAHQSHTWGYVDLDGRILPSAKPWREAARRGYRRGRRVLRETEQAKALFRELDAGADSRARRSNEKTAKKK